MSTPVQITGPSKGWFSQLRLHLPSLPEAGASLLRTIVVALFLLTFVVQPFLIPSESMEHTLLVGDFLLVNKQVFAPAGTGAGLSRMLLPYREVKRGDIVVFHFPQDPRRFLVKRVVGIPGDRLRIEDGRVTVNGLPLDEPYAAFEPAASNPFRDDFPAKVYTDPEVDPVWWKQMQSLTHDGELVVPQGEYFVLGDNRNHSKDSRFWGFVPRAQMVARPLVIYFSLARPSTTDVQQAADDRLGHDRELSAKFTGFARWKRIFHVVH
ncbi:MAG: signal peptidase I [Terracidiphilus sp.]